LLQDHPNDVVCRGAERHPHADFADALRDLRQVRESLRGADEPGEPFHYPSVVADWGLDYFAAETRHTKRALARLSTERAETR